MLKSAPERTADAPVPPPPPLHRLNQSDHGGGALSSTPRLDRGVGREASPSPLPHSFDTETEEELLAELSEHPGRSSTTVDEMEWWSGEGGSKFNASKWQARGTTNTELLQVLKGEAQFRVGTEIPLSLEYIGKGPFGNYPGIVSEDMRALVQAEFDWYERAHLAERCPQGVPPQEFVQVVSPWNAVWKPGKEGEAVRPVFDTSASGLNDCLVQWPFSLPQRSDVLRAMYPGCYLALRDMKWGFYHCRVHPAHRRFLGFRHPFTGELWRFRALPFGVKHSPALFCMVTEEFRRLLLQELEQRGIRRWIPNMGAHMEKSGVAAAKAWSREGQALGRYSVEVFAYVDDFPIIACSREDLEATFVVMDELARELGLSFNPDKDAGRPLASELVTEVAQDDGVRTGASRSLKILGAFFESWAPPGPGGCVVRAGIPDKKRAQYLAAVEQLCASAGRNRRVKVKEFASVLGKLAFCASLMRWGKVYTAALYETLGGRHRGFMAVPRPVLEEDLAFWRRVLHPEAKWRGLWQWHVLEHDDFTSFRPMQAASDASFWGMGGVWGLEAFQIQWPDEDPDLHIAWLELQAIVECVKRWASEWAGQCVLFHCDNSQAVSYVNKGGGRLPEGRARVRELAALLTDHMIELRAVHIAGKLNVRSDRISRNRDAGSTCDYMFRPFDRYNSRPHTVDAAASANGVNAQPGVAKWFSAASSFLSPEVPELVGGERIWANPPFDLVGQFLDQIVRAWHLDGKTTATVVVPKWESQWWWRRYFIRNVFRVVHTYEAGEELFWAEETERHRKGERSPRRAGPTRWPVVVATFPTTAVQCRAPPKRRGGWDPARSLRA